MKDLKVIDGYSIIQSKRLIYIIKSSLEDIVLLKENIKFTPCDPLSDATI